MANPWYSYPQDSPGGGYGETPEPLDPRYHKPDTNIQVPAGTPITALLSGTVTDVSDRGRTAGGLSVTVLLDQPWNDVATHISYNYLGSTSVAAGQHVQSGQTVGIAGSPTGIFTAVALGSDNVWGSGPGFALNAVGDPRLDPRPVLAAANKGALGMGVPAGWHDDGTTLVAPNGVHIMHGFRTWVLSHDWDANNWPLGPEFGRQPLEDSNPSLGGGTQIIFRLTMLGFTQQRGVFQEWIGQELLQARQQIAALSAQVQQLKQSQQPPSP
jgi:hypothetical protein